MIFFFDQLQDIKGKRVLDFGSGFGLVANHLAQENQVLAVEPNEEMVAFADPESPLSATSRESGSVRKL